MELFLIFIGAMLVNNFVLSQFLGICSFIGVSKKKDAAVGMGLAVTFVMVLASIISWLVYNLVLDKLNITYLKTIVFVLVIASLVQFVEMVVKKYSPSLYKALGIFLPLITTNCAVLGMAVTNVEEGYNLIQSIVHALGAAGGFMLAIVLMSFLREKIDDNEEIHPYFRGLPITLFTAALMSIAFLGFQGLI
ncbi:electron transport complex subunit RsxA [Clostridium perfringens]|uniref:Ion-translocating oxidoreductase complex subunit A n=1 Tax=Clostridium perfringens E str. JGS1987 TaxID=451755 RepID=B1BY31_CLOPF|nr:electron transport complex subunit RsxA [Clostridium perfringens]EDT13391.1 electron transport complex, RnfABCDGE type, A subunit [Clostridium perfringens E str. JGS1987]EHK2338084.1 electron transport complex subunit RsxA [Clostridium perfringens]EIF5084000.1 electron transport complex subunit RsxA [Clostridium perfringens]EJT6557709.1 electron transport complex subunit RsxA [Clostridium perfringens]ELC8459076.1 electron transport complex subunit RsxA [Clostridium perfringens]